MFILLTGFTVANVATRTLALRTTTLSNPFATYADIFPGQPATAIEARAFSCPSNYNDYKPPTGLYCSFTPIDSIFSSVVVVIDGGKIQQLNFVMRRNALTVGDLELILQTPATHRLTHTVYFAFPQQKSFALAQTSQDTAQFSVFLPVWRISFTQIASPSS
jgi:hypothetical protein